MNKLIGTIIGIFGRKTSIAAAAGNNTKAATAPNDPFSTLKPGDVFHGRVVKVAKDYALVESDEYGILAKLDRNRFRIDLDDLRTVIRVGEVLDTKVYKVDVVARRIRVERLGFSPEEVAAVKLGRRLHGVVINVGKRYALVQLDGGILATVGVRELSWGDTPDAASDVLSIGDEADFIIVGVDQMKRGVYLSLRHATGVNPWVEIAEQYPAGKMLTGKVVANLPFGLLVEVAPGIRGAIYPDAMCGHTGFPIGARLRLVVRWVNVSKGHLSLGYAGQVAKAA